jgi:hypothetical protein
MSAGEYPEIQVVLTADMQAAFGRWLDARGLYLFAIPSSAEDLPTYGIAANQAGSTLPHYAFGRLPIADAEQWIAFKRAEGYRVHSFVVHVSGGNGAPQAVVLMEREEDT